MPTTRSRGTIQVLHAWAWMLCPENQAQSRPSFSNLDPSRPFGRAIPDHLGQGAKRCCLGLDLFALGTQRSTFRPEVGPGHPFALTLISKCRAGASLPIDGRERGCGSAAFGGFLDRKVNLVEPPVEVGNVVGSYLDLRGNGCVLRFDVVRRCPSLPHMSTDQLGVHPSSIDES